MKKRSEIMAIAGGAIVVVAVVLIVIFSASANSLMGISITYRETGNDDIFALDFREHNAIGDTYVVGLQYDTSVVKPVAEDGSDATSILLAVQPMSNGDATTDKALRDELNTDPMGWASFSGVRYKEDTDNVIIVGIGTDPAQSLELFNVEEDTIHMIPPKKGLDLFSIYFAPVEGKTLADIDENTFSITTTGNDAPRGVSVIRFGQIIADGVEWIDVPGKTKKDNLKSHTEPVDLMNIQLNPEQNPEGGAPEDESSEESGDE